MDDEDNHEFVRKLKELAWSGELWKLFKLYRANLTEQARADEREKCKRERDALLREFEKRLYAAKQEASADERRKCESNGYINEIRNEQFNKGIKKGQAELIEKLKDWMHATVFIANGDWQFVMNKLIDLEASESLGRDATRVAPSGHDAKLKPEKPQLLMNTNECQISSCKQEKPCKHSKGEFEGCCIECGKRDCKPKKVKP